MIYFVLLDKGRKLAAAALVLSCSPSHLSLPLPLSALWSIWGVVAGGIN